jgi:hypothetical protein
MINTARVFFLIGIIFLAIGGLLYLAAKVNLPIGRLPGDFHIQSGNFTAYLPCATSILLSILLTVVLNAVFRLLNK